MNRRGFAMPIVIVLALVAGILAAVVLERQAMQRRVVARELESYRSGHFERGVREVVGQWTDTLVGESIQNLLDEDGHALDIERPDGSMVSIYLFDGQGTALSEPLGTSEQESRDAEGILTEMERILGRRSPTGEFFRPVGSPAVSVLSAPREVLEAIGAYARGGRSARRFADSLMDARRDGEVTEAEVNTAFSAGDLSAEERAIARRLLVLQPELWNTVVDVWVPTGKGSGELVARYGGRFQAPGQAAQRGSVMVSMGKFLSWEPLPIDEERPN